MEYSNDTSRRNFLQAIGAAPSLALLRATAGQAQAAPAEKFTSVDLSEYFNTSPREFAANLSASARRDLEGIPSARATLYGIPFELGAGGDAKSWLAVRGQTVEILLGEQKAGFICLAQFCDWAEYCPDDAVCENFVRPADFNHWVAPGRILTSVYLPPAPCRNFTMRSARTSVKRSFDPSGQ